jgi:hypothetical protein
VPVPTPGSGSFSYELGGVPVLTPGNVPSSYLGGERPTRVGPNVTEFAYKDVFQYVLPIGPSLRPIVTGSIPENSYVLNILYEFGILNSHYV